MTHMYKRLGLALALLATATLAHAQSLRSVPRGRVLVAAHRGDWHYMPENSLAGFKLAMDSGVDILETDVRLSSDSVLVIMHDYTLERTTTGSGRVEETSYQTIRSLRLKNAQGSRTEHPIPTLEQVLDLCKGRMLVYFDKAHQDPKGMSEDYKVRRILSLLREKGMLEQGVFVLPWSYDKAKRIFGDDLERVNYIPVVSSQIEGLDGYVSEWIEKLHPVAFQFRIAVGEADVYAQLPKVRASGSRCFVAATWHQHTMGHDDQISLTDPSKGWGWLMAEGFDIIETNYYKELIHYAQSLGKR